MYVFVYLYQGLYDYPSHTYNVFTEPGACDYQNTPSTWTHQPEVNPTVVDAPYSSYSQVDGSSQLYDARGEHKPTNICKHAPARTNAHILSCINMQRA